MVNQRKDCCRVNFRLAAYLLLLLAPAAVAGPRHPSPNKPGADDPGYVLALATVNRFLNAWQTGDLETGMVLLSNRARRSQTAESLEQFFARGADRAFEVTRGHGNHGRYSFPVVLVMGQDRRVHRKFSEIIVATTGKNDWAIDKLPLEPLKY
jgi:hypothetical protein